MLGILWFLFVTFTISASLIWVLDNNGSVIITWLGYQIQTDILTAILLAIFFTVFTFFISYLAARILAIKFPNLLKIFFRRSHVKRLEKLVHRHHKAFQTMSQLLLALENSDQNSSIELQKKFSKLIKNQPLNNFFLGKIFFEKKEFSKAAELFAKFPDDKNAKILILKSKLQLAIQNNDETSVMAYAEQILSVQKNDFATAKILLTLYKKRSLWQEAKKLITDYGSAEGFKDELQKRDLTIIHSSLAMEAYQHRKFSTAIKHAKITLKIDNEFLPAIEVLLKSLIKRGFTFQARWLLKKTWRKNPHLVLAEIYDFINRKFSPKNRLKMMKKFAELNAESALGKLAIAIVAFRTGEYATAQEFLRLSLLQEKTYRAYRLSAFVEKALNNSENFSKNLKKAAMLERDDHYICNCCTHASSSWSAKCVSCHSQDSLEWSN
jgi:HemY protein